MGAINFSNSVKAKNAVEGYDILVDEALYEHGHNPYNGTISTCDMGRCTLSFKKFKEENYDKAYEHIEKNDWGSKWVADYIDMGKDDNGDSHFLFYGWASI